MKTKNQKLTMVSITFKGVTKTTFVLGTVQSDGKTVVPKYVIDALLASAGCIGRGLTYTFG